MSQLIFIHVPPRSVLLRASAGIAEVHQAQLRNHLIVLRLLADTTTEALLGWTSGVDWWGGLLVFVKKPLSVESSRNSLELDSRKYKPLQPDFRSPSLLNDQRQRGILLLS